VSFVAGKAAVENFLDHPIPPNPNRRGPWSKMQARPPNQGSSNETAISRRASHSRGRPLWAKARGDKDFGHGEAENRREFDVSL
jgi:hypothetical protein